MNERPTLLKPVRPDRLASEGDFQLGDIVVRPSHLELRAGHWREILEPRVMQVLVALAAANGMVVSRDELIRECWGGRTVGDDAINRCVARIRRIADLSGNKAFEVETIPRVGYRLVASRTDRAFEAGEAPVAVAQAATDVREAEVAAPRARSSSGKLALSAVIAIGVLAVTVVATLLAERRNHNPQPPRRTAQVAAVLPFTALDLDKAAQTFADEISADVADTLGRTEFSVISPEQSFQFRGDAKARAARALHADILVDGDVKRSGDNLVVSVRVEDVASNLVLLSKEIRRPAAEGADLPDQVATFVAGAIGSDVSRMALRSGGSPWVHGEVLRAFFQCPSRQDPLCTFEIARNLARIAPGNAMAQTMLAVETTNVLDLLPEGERPQAIAAARRAAWTAIRLNPHFGGPYIALGVLAPDIAANEAYLRRGLLVDSDAPSVAGYLSGLMLETGRTREAATVIQKIAERYAFLYFVPLRQSLVLLERGHTDDALESARRGLRLWPERDLFGLLLFEGTMLENNAPALEALMRDPTTGPKLGDQPTPITQDVVQGFRTRRVGDIDAVVRDCGQVAAGDWPHQQVCMIALVMLGRLDDVFRLPVSPGVGRVFFLPQMAPLRADPRFIGLTKKRGLFAYWKKTHTRPDVCATERVPLCQALAEKGT